MTQTSRPFTGTTPGDAGPYSASDWWDAWKYLCGIYGSDNGPLVGSGTAPNKGLEVTEQSPLARGVLVVPGAANVQGTFYKNTANVALTIAANASGLTRIDTIVAERNETTQTVRLAVVQGTPAASPVPPTLTQGSPVYQVPLADVTVVNGAATIANAVIAQRSNFQNTADGIYLYGIQNRSGGTLQTGDVVVWNAAQDRSVTTTTEPGHRQPAGVWVGLTPSLGYGRILVRGTGYVRATGNLTRIDPNSFLSTGPTAKIASAGYGNGAPCIFAMPLESNNFGAGSGLIYCYVDAVPLATRDTPYFGNAWFDNGANLTTTSTTFVDTGHVGRQFLMRQDGVYICGFNCDVFHSVGSSVISFDLVINGVRFDPGGNQDGLVTIKSKGAGVGFVDHVSWTGIFNPTEIFVATITPGLTTLLLYWRTSAATASMLSGNGVAGQDTLPHIWIKEIG